MEVFAMAQKGKKPFVCLILAAGQGTRMKSKTPKVLHRLCGMPMIDHVVRTAQKLGPEKMYLVVGFKKELLRSHLGDAAEYITQSEQLGTGHAVMQAEDVLSDYKGDVIVLYGDVPLLREDTLRALLKKHWTSRSAATIVTTNVTNPFGFGRIIRDRSRKIRRIVEEKDATPAQKRKREINPGIYCFKSAALLKALKKLDTANEQQEYYLTDVIEILLKQRKKVETVTTEDEIEIMQVNDRTQLATINRIMHDRVLDRLMTNGVTILDPPNTYVSESVEVERDVTIYPFTYIEGSTRIGEGTVIGPQTYIAECEIEENVVITMSYLSECIVRANSRIGPFAHLRPEALIGENVHIGNFVEVKKSIIEDGSKANHLSYIGDSKIGKGVNIGAGTITANYDGRDKHETVIEDGASIGSGTVLIAPVKVGRNAKTGAGAVVPSRRNIPAHAVFVGVPAQEIKPKEKP
jgi:bifunctional UDP-N-acetylglucosamine pyrophosphorylase/glucosamine-1-phosphate N-acetyltransferase